MDELRKGINQALYLLRQISVNGDDVERMAMVKATLSSVEKLAVSREREDARMGTEVTRDGK